MRILWAKSIRAYIIYMCEKSVGEESVAKKYKQYVAKKSVGEQFMGEEPVG